MAREMQTPDAAPRSAPARSPAVFTLPNALSVLRVLLIPPFLTCYFNDQLRVAALIFAVAAGTDLLDGLLARLLHQRSALGALLDPFADKLLALASITALVLHGPLPGWLLALSLTRDAVVLAVGAVSWARGKPARVVPTRIGKYATLFANLAVIVALAQQIAYAPWLTGLMVAISLIAGECLAVASFQYAWRCSRQP